MTEDEDAKKNLRQKIKIPTIDNISMVITTMCLKSK